MEFDQEMDEAALKIQKHYKNKRKKPQNAGQEPMKTAKNKEKHGKFSRKLRGLQGKLEEVVDMELNEDMENAAKIIQQKYRKKQQNKLQKPDILQEKRDFRDESSSFLYFPYKFS